jgi:hypothetical protein
MFYVYEHYRQDTNAVFYVGKGKGYRSGSKHDRNQHWHNIVKKADGFSVKFVAKDVDEELAYLCEQERISQLKQLGVSLVNLTIGGEGAGAGKDHHMWGRVHPQKGVKRPWVGMIGSDNPMWGKTSAMKGKKNIGASLAHKGRPRPEGGGKKPHAVVRIDADGVETIYKSVSDAARDINRTRSSIHRCCTGKGKTGGGYKWKYFKEQK